MRPNPDLDIERVIQELGVGEALVSLLDTNGAPGVTQRAFMFAPGSQMGPIEASDRQALMQRSVVAGVYDRAVDRESAFELLRKRTEEANAAATQTAAPAAGMKGGSGAATAAGAGAVLGGLGALLFGSTGPRGGKRDGMMDLVAKSAARTVGSSIGRQMVRGVLGSLLGKRR